MKKQKNKSKREHKISRNERARRQKRKVLPGFPWEGMFQTKEEVDAYFAGDKIQCLLCGKWYQRISSAHLTFIHGISSDEYRARYGLPWGRGLTAESLHKKMGDSNKRRIEKGQLPVFEKNNQGLKARSHPQKPVQPFVRDLRRRQGLAAQRRVTIEEMQQLAASRGGRCLSATYVNMETKLLWQCAEGHQWEAKPHHIKDGIWCPMCARLKQAEMHRLSLEAMQQLAASRGGKCLSATYVNRLTKLLWQCAEGHQWEASPKNIKQGTWCPMCAQVKRRKSRLKRRK